MKTFIPMMTLSFILSSCSTSPTGRKQLNLMSEKQMNQMGEQSFAELKKKQNVKKDPKVNQFVECVSKAVLKGAGEKPEDWEIKVFEDKTPNAFALPGNHIGVHTGMLDIIQNPAQLAAVIGHEIGHVKANHSNERVSQNMVAQTGLVAANVLIGQDSEKDKLLLASLGIGAQVGFLLPFSRKHEEESDRLGVQYMAKAGFDPKQAAELWKQMAKNSKGAPPEFLSTHPSNQSRIEDLTEYAKKYPAKGEAPNCGNW